MALLLAGCTGGKAQDQPQGWMTDVQVFFTKDEVSVPVERMIPAVEDRVTEAFYELVKGPTEAEQAEGISSWFSAETANAIKEITHEEHTVIINFVGDLPRLVPNAPTSAGSAILISSLRETAFQFPDVEELELQLDDSCVAFGDWLQTGECMIIRR